MRTKENWAVAMIAIAALGLASSANAQKVELGGRVSVTAFGAVIYIDPDVGDDATTLLIGGSANYTTENARFEGPFYGILIFRGWGKLRFGWPHRDKYFLP